jgi:hypothetical protein
MSEPTKYETSNEQNKQWQAPLLSEEQKLLNPKRIYLLNAMVGLGIDSTLFQENKIKPALQYIISLNKYYELIPDIEIKNAIKKLEEPNAINIAKEVGADEIFIIKIEQMMNVIRAEIVSANPAKPDTTISSDGYALLHIFNKRDKMPILDPTVLMALQRAFAVTERDSLMFMDLESPYNVKPVPSVILAGIEFKNDSTYSNFEIFNNSVISSYEYLEDIYSAVSNSNDWLVYDIESRDALYSLFNYYLVENDKLPSYNEIAALYRFGIKYYITGLIERNTYGVKFSLFLNMAENGNTSTVKTVSKQQYDNNLPDAKNIIKELATQLLFNN